MLYSKTSLTAGETLLINKPRGWSSFQVVNKIKWAVIQKYGLSAFKVGHAGTLDPLATGLLLICTGKSTKTIDTYQNMDKEYTGIITLGSTTPSHDLETEADAYYPVEHIKTQGIHDAAKLFLGDIEQYPPIFSAIKKDGKRLYEYARKKESIAIAARTVKITSFDITAVKMPDLSFRVRCGKGTYIRSLAYDFGKKLASGAHLSQLCRTKIGQYNLEDALSVEAFIRLLN